MIYEIFWCYFGIILCVNLEREKNSNFICALFLQLNNLTFLHADASCFILWRGSFLIINFQIIYICADLYGYLNTGKLILCLYLFLHRGSHALRIITLTKNFLGLGQSQSQIILSNEKEWRLADHRFR